MQPWEIPPRCELLHEADPSPGTPGSTNVTASKTTESAETEAKSAEAKANGVVVTDAAAAKVKALIEQEGRDDLRLRIAVQPGGCSGLRYQLFFDERSLDGDMVSKYTGFEVVVDRMSLPYLQGASIDFV